MRRQTVRAAAGSIVAGPPNRCASALIKMLPDATVVPPDVAGAARLQAREGFVYLRP